MTYPGELSLEDIKALLVRAHAGEIIPLYVFLKTDDTSRRHEYWARRLDAQSSLGPHTLYYSTRRTGAQRNTGEPLENCAFFTNYWYAYAWAIKEAGKPPHPINSD